MKARDIAFYLVHNFGRFKLRRNICCVENVSWGMDISWEADLWVLSKSKYITEVEIKVDFNDWLKDKGKSKFLGTNWKGHNVVRNFYYAAPMKLAERFQEVWLLEGAGVIGVGDNGSCKVLKEAEVNKSAPKLTDEKMYKLMRLGCMRAFKR